MWHKIKLIALVLLILLALVSIHNAFTPQSYC